MRGAANLRRVRQTGALNVCRPIGHTTRDSIRWGNRNKGGQGPRSPTAAASQGAAVELQARNAGNGRGKLGLAVERPRNVSTRDGHHTTRVILGLAQPGLGIAQLPTFSSAASASWTNAKVMPSASQNSTS